jgi:hypothetical protein
MPGRKKETASISSDFMTLVSLYQGLPANMTSSAEGLSSS